MLVASFKYCVVTPLSLSVCTRHADDRVQVIRPSTDNEVGNIHKPGLFGLKYSFGNIPKKILLLCSNNLVSENKSFYVKAGLYLKGKVNKPGNKSGPYFFDYVNYYIDLIPRPITSSGIWCTNN